MRLFRDGPVTVRRMCSEVRAVVCLLCREELVTVRRMAHLQWSGKAAGGLCCQVQEQEGELVSQGRWGEVT